MWTNLVNGENANNDSAARIWILYDHGTEFIKWGSGVSVTILLIHGAIVKRTSKRLK